MSEPHVPSFVRRFGHALWLLLAAFDALLLAFLALSYDWTYDVPDASTPAAIIVYAIAYAIIAFLTVLTAGAVASIAGGVFRQFRPPRRPSPWLTAIAVAPLILVLLATVFDWFVHVVEIGSLVSTARVDRLLVFDLLSERAEAVWKPWRPVVGDGMTVGLHLCYTAALAYLAEKYLLAWFRVRWPVPFVAIAMVSSLVWVTSAGERGQRDFVAAREWRPIAEAISFPQALEACEALGPRWSLPTKSELALYVATRPEAMAGWTGTMWTNTAAERDLSGGVVVEIAARRSGVWSPGRHGERGVTTCETDTRDDRPVDAFTRQKAWLCETTPDSPYLHAADEVTIVSRRGIAAEFGRAGAVCVRTTRSSAARGPGVQQFKDEQSFATAAEYRDAVREACDARPWPRGFICLSFAADPLPFAEDVTEQMYRLACDHQGRIDGCEGYAKLMTMRGDTERASQYRERAELFESRRKPTRPGRTVGPLKVKPR